MNISSVVVQVKPEHMDSVLEVLQNAAFCDYHFHDEKGRIIITIEGEGVSEELGKLAVVEKIPHVITADMQMAYSEDELDEHMQIINDAEIVPRMLNDDTIDATDIVYNGDLKKKDLGEFAKLMKKH